MTDLEQHLEQHREQQRRAYRQLTDSRRCVDCRIGLTRHEGVHCVSCCTKRSAWLGVRRPYVPRPERPRARVLRVLRRFDWCRIGDIAMALEVDGDPRSNEHNAMAQALCRLVKQGLVEAQGKRTCRDYRLVAARRAA